MQTLAQKDYVARKKGAFDKSSAVMSLENLCDAYQLLRESVPSQTQVCFFSWDNKLFAGQVSLVRTLLLQPFQTFLANAKPDPAQPTSRAQQRNPTQTTGNPQAKMKTKISKQPAAHPHQPTTPRTAHQHTQPHRGGFGLRGKEARTPTGQRVPGGAKPPRL